MSFSERIKSRANISGHYTNQKTSKFMLTSAVIGSHKWHEIYIEINKAPSFQLSTSNII